ncbi:MAG: glucose PTS transporter subunit IIA [Lachnospiraceae bacterium]
MANKVRDYQKLAADIKDMVGPDNIMTATHCATRLRLVLKEMPDDSTTKKIEQLSGVIQVVISGGQYQIVIGTHAKDVYEHLSGMVHFSEEAPKVKESLANRVIAVMSGCIAPYVYVMAAAGLLQGILIIIKMFADIGNTGAAQIYNMVSWTPFTFLPVFIAVAGAKHFKCNTYIALWCCMALANPTWGNIAATISDGTALDFLFVPLTSVTYTSTVIPPIILVAILSKLEHWIEPRLPEVVRPIGTPFICAAVMVPMTILVIGPVSTVLSNGLASAYNMLYKFIPWLASGLFGAIWEVLVIFGIHWSFTPISLTNYQNMGFDTLQAFKGIAVCAQVAACFGVFWKSRNSKVKNMAASSAATGLFGITEPAIYGITLRFKKPFICGCIGSAIGCAVTAFFKSRYFVYAGLPGLLSIPNSIYTESAEENCKLLGYAGNYSSSVIGILIGTVIAVLVTFILVQFIGFDDPVEIPEDTTETGSLEMVSSETGKNITFMVYAPMNGEVKQLSEVPDPTFSEGILGQGAAIIPSDGRLYAPFDGTVSSVFDTKHAVCLCGPEGCEMLIHVGLETVSLNGKYFDTKVKDGDTIKTGDLLMEFNLDAISKDFKTITPILITNADDYSGINYLKTSGPVKAGDALYEVR